jgi:uncharacterized circularly permuted ATP-grasp superfamily protein/uncharacterized alpha-E superfamily protein
VNSQSTNLGYRPQPGTYDEMFLGNGAVRSHWEYLAQALDGLGVAELEQRRRKGERLLRENGVTYNVYGDPQGPARPWELDPIPLLISSDEWAEVESGLTQRAHLLDLILRDLYGPRELIKKGLLPLELIYSQPSFLRACDQIRHPGRHQLILYAADLVRGPGGGILVLGDRTQAPSGAGYALENRTVMARLLPSLYRDSHVHRMAVFFQTLRNALSTVAPPQDGDPRVVVLTPGPHNEAYFEHAFLASYLGYTLVQGSDLRVRDGRVWLDTLSGQDPVDVLVRRVDDHFCDPVELREDSRLGIPGLVESARRGNISIANPLGSGVLENPALMPFLPGIAQYYLGQPLRLDSVPCWWCGQPKARDYVLANLHRLVVKPTLPGPGVGVVFGEALTPKALDELRTRILAQPYHYVAQERVGFSSVPSLVGGSLEPRPAVLRSFLVVGDQGYTVMPGGLTRVAPDANNPMVSNQAGGISKDTWVLASEPERQVSSLPQTSPRVARRDPQDFLPGAAAESLFWLGRYAERAGEAIGLLRVILDRHGEGKETEESDGSESFSRLLRALTHLTATYPGFVGKGADERLRHPEPELGAVILDGSRAGSLVGCLQFLLQAGYAVHDRLSADTWRVIGAIERGLGTLKRRNPSELTVIQEDLNDLITPLVALSGLTLESMIRGQGRLFLDAGRRLERGLLLISLVRSTLVPQSSLPAEKFLLEAVLDSAESLMSFRSNLQLDTVLELLLLDETNPRALCYQIARLQAHLNDLPDAEALGQRKGAKQLLVEASNLLRLTEMGALTQVEAESGLRRRLDKRLSHIAELLSDTSNTISQTYFATAEAPQLLVRTWPGSGS